MPESMPYIVSPESIEAYRVRVLFHCEELKRETDPTVRANIALYLAEAAAILARMEAEAALAATSVA
ncbi:MAG: hypothetical protein AAGA75_01200 [Cyanobacteria bacterium P01_E01_bin.6]